MYHELSTKFLVISYEKQRGNSTQPVLSPRAPEFNSHQGKKFKSDRIFSHDILLKEHYMQPYSLFDAGVGFVSSQISNKSEGSNCFCKVRSRLDIYFHIIYYICF